jgi:hypothetical protein
MVRGPRTRQTGRPRRDRSGNRHPYGLVVRGPDGQPRPEHFKDVSAYRARLAILQPAAAPVTIDELLDLLET